MSLCECGCGREALRAVSHGVRRGPPNRFLHGHQVGRGPTHMNWVGGKSESHNAGYIYITAGLGGESKPEHVAVVEAVLGKRLPPRAVVHHVDENKKNNAKDNLVACEDDAYHLLLHKRLRAFKACGDPNAHRCTFCHKYDRQEDITVRYPKRTIR